MLSILIDSIHPSSYQVYSRIATNTPREHVYIYSSSSPIERLRNSYTPGGHSSNYSTVCIFMRDRGLLHVLLRSLDMVYRTYAAIWHWCCAQHLIQGTSPKLWESRPYSDTSYSSSSPIERSGNRNIPGGHSSNYSNVYIFIRNRSILKILLRSLDVVYRTYVAI